MKQEDQDFKVILGCLSLLRIRETLSQNERKKRPACNPSSQEVEAEGSKIQGHSRLHNSIVLKTER